MKGLLPRWGARMTAVLAVSAIGVGVANLGQGAVAHADPVSSVAFNGAGSDTIQDIVDAFAGYDNGNYYAPLSTGGSTTALPTTLNSWDAVSLTGTASSPGCITTEYGGPTFDRPNGSSGGINALTASQTGALWTQKGGCAGDSSGGNVITGQIQFARSSRGVATSGTTYTFIPFARDALSVAVWEPGGTQNLQAAGLLNQPQLASWYASPATSPTVTLNGTSYTVNLCLPQTGSGSRSFWYTAMGEKDPGTTTGCDNQEENGGNSLYQEGLSLCGGTATGCTQIVIMPFSAGSWISQNNNSALNRTSTGIANGLYLASLDPAGGTGTPVQPYTGTNGSTEGVNTTFYNSTVWGRNVYIVVPSSKVTGFNASATYKAMFVGSTSQLCAVGAANLDSKFGFDVGNSNTFTCGSTTLTGAN